MGFAYNKNNLFKTFFQIWLLICLKMKKLLSISIRQNGGFLDYSWHSFFYSSNYFIYCLCKLRASHYKQTSDKKKMNIIHQ